MTVQIGYDRPAAQLTDDTVVIRASGLFNCARELWYAAHDIKPSDDIPQTNRAAMAMGRALETLVLDEMEQQYPELQVYLRFGENDVGHILYEATSPSGRSIMVTGTPDALILKKDQGLVITDAKARADGWFDQTKDKGNWLIQRESVYQVAQYHLMQRGQWTLGLTTASITTMSRETGEIYVEEFDNAHIEEALELVEERTLEIMGPGLVDGSTVPEVERSFNHMDCKSCVWRTLCGNVTEALQVRSMPPVSYEQAEAQLLLWEPYKVKDTENGLPKAVEESTREVLLAHLTHKDPGEFADFNGEFQDWRVYKRQRSGTKVNTERLREILTFEQWMEVQEEYAGDPYVEIRKAPRKK